MSVQTLGEIPVSASGDSRLAGRVALLRNAALSTSVQYVESAAGILTGVIIARVLGPSEFGHYAFAVWLCGWMLFTANNGLTTSAIRFIAEFRGSQQHSIAEALGATFLRWQTFCTIAVVVVYLLVTLVFPPKEWPGPLYWLVGFAVLAVASRARFWMLAAIGKGFERYEPENYSILGMLVANVIAIALWWYFDRTVIGAFAIYALTGLLCYWLSVRVMRHCEISLRPAAIPAQIQTRVVRTVFSTGILVAIHLLSGRALEVALLKAYWSAETIAYFVIAGTLTKGAVDLLTTGLASVLLPVMSRAFGRSGQARVGVMMSESIRYYWFIGLLISGLGIVVTQGAVALLYGSQYEAAIPAITWSLVIAGLGSFSGALGAFQTASDYQNDRIMTAVATLLINLATAFALVPTWGLNGAILSLAITRFASIAFQYVMVRRRVPVRIKWEVIFRLTFAALIAGELAVIVETLLHSRGSFVLSAMVFVAAFLLISVLLRAWYARDYALLAEVLRRFGSVGAKLAKSCRRMGRRFAI